MSLAGVIFDLDGTLVDSRLDFNAIRRDLGLRDGEFILEALEAMPEGPHKNRCLDVLSRYEERGAREATLFPGVADFLDQLTQRGIRHGILTRNSRETTDMVVQRLKLSCWPVLTRDDVPAKPDPAGLLRICRRWELTVDRVLFFGDFLFDLQAGRNAGIRTVLFCPEKRSAFADEADFVIHSFHEATGLLDALDDCF